ncbi:MAG: hypothetical protein JSS10_06765 [Verrucomicrobia bacterium]|nr:hypothetical protein [Verrucomicrobiota bacterium]
MTPVQLPASPISPIHGPSFIPASLRTLNWKVGVCFAAALVLIIVVIRKLVQTARLDEEKARLAEESKTKLAEGIDLAPDPYGRRMELKPEDLKALHTFYQENGILDNEREPIDVDDYDSLELGDLSASITLPMLVDLTNIESDGAVCDQTVTVREVVYEVIKRINQEIKKAPALTPVRQARMVGFPTGRWDLFSQAFSWGIQPGDKDDNNRLLIRILDALVAKGYLFKRGEPSGRAVWVQA